eukprot:2373787-Amphidinium_carterae.2
MESKTKLRVAWRVQIHIGHALSALCGQPISMPGRAVYDRLSIMEWIPLGKTNSPNTMKRLAQYSNIQSSICP